MEGLRIKAVSIGEAISSLGERGLKGEVVGVFRNTVNIETCVEPIVVTNKGVLSPITINIDMIDFLKHVRDFRDKVVVGDLVEINDKCLEFLRSGLAIDMDESAIYSVKDLLRRPAEPCRGLSIHELKSVSEKYLRIAAIIDKAVNREFIPYIIEGSLSLYSSIKDSENPLIIVPDNALKHLGLGDGLTPAYDDFLGGLLGGLMLISRLRNLKLIFRIKNRYLNNTTPTSRRLLTFLTKGVTNNLILEASISYCMNDPDDLLERLVGLLQVGHSSGTYLGIGSLIALFLDAVLHSRRIPSEGGLKSILKELIKF